ncbi:protein of unknown function [Nitrospira defluvii]|uniref:Uncharacterized protein n=1 Tax=Nitrospira defluvii TaxID=330214 RepID=D8P9M3_9BACT|nr:protein of unknown function [Nitrospira defluvii]
MPYGELLSDARTPLADFFRILLGVVARRGTLGRSRLVPATTLGYTAACLAGARPTRSVNHAENMADCCPDRCAESRSPLCPRG